MDEETAVAVPVEVEHAVVVPAAEAPVEIPATQLEVIEASTDADVARIEAEGKAEVARIEAEGKAAAAVAEAIAPADERLTQCEAEISELRAMTTSLMSALEATQATLALLIPPASEPSSEPIPTAVVEAEAVTVLPPESVVEENPAARMQHRARRRLI